MPLPEDFADLLEDVERRAVEAGLRAVPGVADAIRSVAASGVATCVASNGPPEAVAQRLKLTGLYSWFEGRLFSASMVARGKPHPDLFLHAAQTLGVPPSQCVVVEDSAPGARAGLAAGMRVLRVCDRHGTPPQPTLRALNASPTWPRSQRCSVYRPREDSFPERDITCQSGSSHC